MNNDYGKKKYMIKCNVLVNCKSFNIRNVIIFAFISGKSNEKNGHCLTNFHIKFKIIVIIRKR